MVRCLAVAATMLLFSCDEEVPVQQILITPNNVTIKMGESFRFTATVEPENATYDRIVWGTSDMTVADVDQEGLVTAVMDGKAKITASAGGKYSFVWVTVPNILRPVTSVTLDKNELTMVKGSTAKLNVTVGPEDAILKAVTWASSDSTVVEVDQIGNLTALENGNATISVTSLDQGITATCAVTVHTPYVPVEDISLSFSDFTVTQGSFIRLKATVLPEDATNKEVTWSSQDKTIATVDQEGKVTGVNVGQTVVSCTTVENLKTAKCYITVKPKAVHATAVTVVKPADVMFEGQTRQFRALQDPAESSDEITWSASAPLSALETGMVTCGEIAPVTREGLNCAVTASASATVSATDSIRVANINIVDLADSTIYFPGDTIRLKRSLDYNFGFYNPLTASMATRAVIKLEDFTATMEDSAVIKLTSSTSGDLTDSYCYMTMSPNGYGEVLFTIVIGNVRRSFMVMVR